jgi:hypothetical protein
MNISYVHHDIPLDLTLAAEENNHPPLLQMVVLTIKVWRPEPHSWYAIFGS